MKKIASFTILAVIVLPLIVFPAGASGAPAREGGTTFNEAEGKDWFLSELKSAGKTINIDRKTFEADNMAGFFSVSFRKDKASNENRMGGMGAPNRYFGPYSAGSNRTLRIGNIASTMMMAFKEPDELKEHEYFSYLNKVTRWDIREGKLELYSLNSDGTEAALIFISN